MNIPADYVDVAERIRQFKAAYPEGSLQPYRAPELMVVGDRTFIAYCAAAYRTPDDERPGVGWAWEPVPGPTPFTRDSELMNAETSAWGRAIVALGFETKKIASAEEVRNRRAERPAKPLPESPLHEKPRVQTPEQLQELATRISRLELHAPKREGQKSYWEDVQHYSVVNFGINSSTDLNGDQMETILEEVKRWEREEAVPFQ